MSCGVCGAPVTVPYLSGARDYQFGVDFLAEIKGCSICGLLQQSPMPTREQALAFYPKNYTHYNFTPSRLRSLLIGIYFRPLTKLLLGMGANPSQTLLDIGCGPGEKAAFLRDRLGLQVVGLEPNELAAKRARDIFGVETINDFFPSKKIGPQSFDFVYFNHVIEHVPDPVALLNSSYETLKPGGWLIGETENITSLSSRVFGRYWSLCHMPFHLYFFSPDTLRRTFAASMFGPPTLETLWDPSVVVISLQNILRRHKAPGEIRSAQVPGYFAWLLLTSPLAVIEQFNGPIIRFWVQKPNL